MLGRNHKEKHKKDFSMWILYCGIALMAYLYIGYYNNVERFHFPSRSVNKKAVVETGKVKFSSGNELVFENIYKSKETVIKNGSKLTVTGKYKGKIDEKLLPYLKNDTYYIEVDSTGSGFDISSEFSAIYPVALRRFLYFMPVKKLFDNKKWEVVTKNEEFTCSYQLFLKADRNYVSIICSGVVGNNNVAMIGGVVFNSELNGFRSTELEITAENLFQISNWKFKEDFIKGDLIF